MVPDESQQRCAGLYGLDGHGELPRLVVRRRVTVWKQLGEDDVAHMAGGVARVPHCAAAELQHARMSAQGGRRRGVQSQRCRKQRCWAAAPTNR